MTAKKRTGVNNRLLNQKATAKSEHYAPEVSKDTNLPVEANFPDKMQSLFKPSRYKVAFGGRGSGKAICVDEIIPTPTGWLRLGDIQVGDQVIDELGNPCNVTEIHDEPIPERCYRLTFSDGATIDANGEHEWVTWTHAERKSLLRSPYDAHDRFPINWTQWRRQTRQGYSDTAPQIRTTEAIRETLTHATRGDLNHCIPLTEPLNLPYTQLPIDPYVFGYWLGNGTKHYGTVTTGSLNGEFDVVEVIYQFEAAGYDCHLNKSSNQNSHVVSSKQLACELRTYGLRDKQTIPEEYLRASTQQRLAFLRGLMDSDGTASKDTNVASFTNTNKLISETVFELAISLGQKPTWREDRAKLNGVDHGAVYTVSWRPNIDVFTLERKARNITPVTKQALRTRHRMITSVETIPSKPMRCLTVDGPNSMYLVGKHMIPTHNSWSIARALLILGKKYKIRVLCVRETQTSIADSVHQLLCDQIYALKLDSFYYIEKNIIQGRNGTDFKFAGIKANPAAIKSFEGCNICWVEEAATLSQRSLDILTPTIRGEGFIPGTDAEIWFSFNPELEEDPVYKKFVLNPPDDACIIKVNFHDNPWCPKVLLKEQEDLKQADYKKWLNIWMGETRQFLEGAVYLDQLEKLAEKTESYPDSRICNVPYLPNVKVCAFFDLGFADATAIWIVQQFNHEVRCIKYFEQTRRTIDNWHKELCNLDYPIDHIYLPHDAKQKNFASNGKSAEEQFRAKGYKVSIVPNISLAAGIDALRTLLPRMLFDKLNCVDGIICLKRYRFAVKENAQGQFSEQPVHDKFSHGADSARYIAVGLMPEKPKKTTKYSDDDYSNRRVSGQHAWMSR